MGKSDKDGKKRIVFIGKSNVGKSSLVNAFLGKEFCSTNDDKTADKDSQETTMQLPPCGSVVIVDTDPIDDSVELKQDKLKRTIEILSSADFVVVVLDAREKISQTERSIFYQLKNLSIPFVVAVNKIEFGVNSELINGLRALNAVHFEISCKEEVGIDALKTRITRQFQRKPAKASKS